ncbi:MAG: hypothetical protein EZS28_029440 [Streblomastix strix]|uniref:DDE-1 domain-containing protein n=1 Tax=Streblomastix strix TaxID=222440 RepID=A0A5J4UXN2_9EUKA|nr:MAG: hypothetical protein EZS28_029440 [Streblomastix strix]
MGHHYEARIEELQKKTVRVREFERIMAETQEALIPMYIGKEVIQVKHKQPKALQVNFDEMPLRLSQSQYTTLICTDKYLSPAIVAPPRMRNYTIVLAICLDGSHLCSFIQLPLKHFPEEFKDLRAFDVRIITLGSGWITKEILEEDVMPVQIDQLNERRKIICQENSEWHYLLTFDSHDSLINLNFMNRLKAEKIDAFSLTPHSSGNIQPCDLGSNAELKKELMIKLGGNLELQHKNQENNQPCEFKRIRRIEVEIIKKRKTENKKKHKNIQRKEMKRKQDSNRKQSQKLITK